MEDVPDDESGTLICVDCLKEMFILATTDESLYPPTCCSVKVSIHLAAPYLTSEETKAFMVASRKFNTTGEIYCSNPQCAKIIPLPLFERAGGHARCSSCGHRTCLYCRKEQHAGTCPDMAPMRKWLAENGGKICPNPKCRQGVQLIDGCNCMT